jgi:two-component sensor histidine kinase
MLAFAGQLVFTGNLTWNEALTITFRDWVPWVVLAPAAGWLAMKFPLEWQRLHISIPVHVVACMLAVLACEYFPRPSVQQPGRLPPWVRQYYPQWRPGDPLPPRPGYPGPNRPLNPEYPRPLSEPRPGEDALPREGPPPGQERLAGQEPRPGPEARRPFQLAPLIMRARFNIPIYWVIVSLAHALRYYRHSRERERSARELEGRLTAAKLEALRMQLHPHFLFNTLNAISTLVHRDPDAADEMIANLSELLRATLDTTEQEIPLRGELEFLDRYLEIQRARFGERLQVEKRVDPGLMNALVPTLILQPVVENAIRHGLEPQTGQGILQLEARSEAGQLLLIVRDNGAGLEGDTAPTKGIGITNTRSRLTELYGASASLSLANVPSGGCEVRIGIPYHENPSNYRR